MGSFTFVCGFRFIIYKTLSSGSGRRKIERRRGSLREREKIEKSDHSNF